MKRAYALDVLTCPRCSGPMELLSLIEDEATAVRILDHLGLSARAPPRGRTWRGGEQPLALADAPADHDAIDPPSSFD